ncbi:MAG: hypothetical protein JRM78_03630 [Nitrososphaerota archaeon]|nr:hypothetical protein [Nitrososphaerota archaeon]
MRINHDAYYNIIMSTYEFDNLMSVFFDTLIKSEYNVAKYDVGDIKEVLVSTTSKDFHFKVLIHDKETKEPTDKLESE